MTKLSQPITETLFELWERLNEKSCASNDAHKDRPNATTNGPQEFCSSNQTFGTTGISFIDAALSLCDDDAIMQSSTSTKGVNRQKSKPMVIDIIGDTGTGKTATIVTLAARYLFATRRCQLPNDTVTNDAATKRQQIENSSIQMDDESMSQPQVILFDINRNVTNCAKRVYDILASMLREEHLEMNQDKENHGSSVHDDNGMLLHTEVMECLQRLHVARVDDFPQWVLLLETLRQEMTCLKQQQQYSNNHTNHPTTLLLWDDFLDEVVLTTPAVAATNSFHAPSSSTSAALSYNSHTSYYRSTRSEMTAIRMDVIRQVERLLQECPQNTILVTTASTATTKTTNHTIGGPNIHPKRVIGKEWNRFVTHCIHLESYRDHAVTSTPTVGSHALPHYESSFTSSFARQRSNSQYLRLATIIRNNNSTGNIAPPEPRQQHIKSFCISDEGIVS
jgi:hypothetical protein